MQSRVVPMQNSESSVTELRIVSNSNSNRLVYLTLENLRRYFKNSPVPSGVALRRHYSKTTFPLKLESVVLYT